jgi:hypothetical protein
MCSSNSDDDVDTCINRQRGAVNDQVVEPCVVLPLFIEEACIVIPRAVDIPLSITGGSRVGVVLGAAAPRVAAGLGGNPTATFAEENETRAGR